jgi:hypothetical protein
VVARRLAIMLSAPMAIVLPGAIGAPTVAAAGTAGTCVPLIVNGHHDCLVAGRTCHSRYEKLYEGKGFNCVRDAAGRYHLRAAIHAGPIRY